MSMLQFEGILVEMVDFQDYDRILTFFSAKRGLLKGFYRGGKKKPLELLAHYEGRYRETTSGFLQLHDLLLVQRFSALRNELTRIEAVGAMTQALVRSQGLHAPAPALYQLFVYSLDNVDQMEDPFTLAGSFLLKILRHDGLLSELRQCDTCDASLDTLHFLSRAFFCQAHAPVHALAFDEDETLLLNYLGWCRQLGSMAPLRLPPLFFEKIKQFFYESLT